MPRPRVSNVGIHIQLNPPFTHPCPILYPPIPPCPIIPPPSIEPVIAPLPKNRKSTTTPTSPMIKGVLFDSLMTLNLPFRLTFSFRFLLHLHLFLHAHFLI